MDPTSKLKQQVNLKKAHPSTEKRLHLLFNISLLFISVGFGILAFFARNYAYFSVDLAITLWIQKISWYGFNELMVGITTLGNPDVGPFLIIAIVFLLLILKKAKAAGIALLSTLGISIIGQAIKVAIQRPRPDPSLINQLSTFTRDDSFPSGHVLFAIGLFGILVYLFAVQFRKTLLTKILMIICGLLIFLMGVSRIYVGAHWFSDTLGSYLIGFIWLSLMAFVYHKVNKT